MTISQVSKIYGISIDTIRYYEKIKVLPKIPRKNSGVREFTEIDCEWVYFVVQMRKAGVSIDSLVEYVRLFMEGSSTKALRKEILIKERQALEEQMNNLKGAWENLDDKIKNYDKVLPCEKALEERKKQEEIMNKTVEAIEAASKRWRDAFNRGDFKGCTDQYKDDAIMRVKPFGEFVGREAIEKFWENLLADGFKDVEYIDTKIEGKEDTGILSSKWKMNKAHGIITKELWVVEDGIAKLEEDDFEVLG